ncbi:phosphogluconate dehydratase [Phaeovulum vinaykumarii]|uniref:Phosphogluconate dehydratase n=1 Tax=Phaeovulum vinaykumarii TaxID=407234 RepID=A0A1N7MV96_9RHOB|nr:phosphogluconate dehydratase [Phaeovulum vinaykumarii]SIS90047.1 6-phosphogluconate dehydratase [Phaeovulum vinaykumarii]SOC16830.1 6-phosphogluconate dehydratase [Phaeovulum vinaykumarii]
MAQPLHPEIARVTDRIRARSAALRAEYLAGVRTAQAAGPARAHLSCGNQAHAYAGTEGADKAALAEGRAPNLGIVTAYNDMLSAHAPYADYPEQLRAAARAAGATVQVAGGVPAMCDGVTQGRGGMELSLFSRDVIALAAALALSHDTYDAALFLGVCDKIVPGLVMAAARFGHLPAIFVPAGPMTSGLPNDEKAAVRQAFARGEVDRTALMAAEMASYHGQGTCTFYGTANSNQMLMEVMGLHLPGAAFVPPAGALRTALTKAAATRAAAITALGDSYTPVAEVLDERAFVNGIVGLMATGGSTNLVLHLPAMARAAGIVLEPADFAAISGVVPLLARVYPNGLADVNHFHAAGGIGFVIGQLIEAGLVHEDVQTIAGPGLARYAAEPVLKDGALHWRPAPATPANDRILRPAKDPFSPTGGLRELSGNLGHGVIKVSAVAPERHVIEAPARIFADQAEVKAAWQAGAFTADTVIVVRFQGPRANGMPELHGLTPVLSVLQDRGLRVALVTDGRMSGASGKVASAIHIAPEAAMGGPLARLRDGDLVRLDATTGRIDCLAPDFESRAPVTPPPRPAGADLGRSLFGLFRDNAGPATEGASVLF